jgi:hypothetical protein
MLLCARNPAGADEQARHEANAQHNSAYHVSPDRRTCVARAVRQHVSERKRWQRNGDSGAKHKVACFAQGGAFGSDDLKHGKQKNQANGEMQKSRMKASEELQPIGMRVAVELENERQYDEKNAGSKDAEPCGWCDAAALHEAAGCARDSFRSNHASNPLMTYAGAGPVRRWSSPWKSYVSRL